MNGQRGEVGCGYRRCPEAAAEKAWPHGVTVRGAEHKLILSSRTVRDQRQLLGNERWNANRSRGCFRLRGPNETWPATSTSVSTTVTWRRSRSTRCQRSASSSQSRRPLYPASRTKPRYRGSIVSASAHNSTDPKAGRGTLRMGQDRRRGTQAPLHRQRPQPGLVQDDDRRLQPDQDTEFQHPANAARR